MSGLANGSFNENSDTPLLTELRALPPESQAPKVREWLGTRPAELFAELRENQPVLSIPGIAIASKYEDVVEILAHDTSFGVNIYGPRMARLSGDFILGMPDGEQYERELAILKLAARREDVATVKQLIAKTAAECVASVASSGKIEVVETLTRAVTSAIVQEYFGVAAPDEKTLRRWLRVLFWDIFLNLSDAPEVRQEADKLAVDFRAYLKLQVTALQALVAQGGDAPDTVLGRLVKLAARPETALSTDDLVRNIGGMIIAVQETTSQATVQAIDQLLDRPQLAEASKAARSGADIFPQYVFEALRFKPQNPFLFRVCTQDFTLAKGTPRETLVKAGTFVVAATSSAMMDPEVFDAPGDFKIDRPMEKYMFWGRGLHACFGRYINAISIPEIARPLLALQNLRRATGDDGKIGWEGPFPRSLTLTFDAVAGHGPVKPGELPLLITIPPSLGSESARWILQHAKIEFREERHAVLTVNTVVQKAGGTEFPALITADKVYSADQIYGYAEALAGDRKLEATPTFNPEDLQLAADILALSDGSARWGYFLLLPHRELMIPVFQEGLSDEEKVIVSEHYPESVIGMTQVLKISPESAAAGLALAQSVFKQVEKKLADGRRYLADNRFTIVDLLFAVYSSPFLMPDEYGGSLPPFAQLPPEMKKVVSDMRETVAGKYALRIYREERRAK